MNNFRILTIKNAKLSEYYFHMNLNIKEDFQIYISVYTFKSSTFKFLGFLPLSWLHFNNKPRVQEKQWVKDQQFSLSNNSK